MRGYPQFSFWISITLAINCPSRIFSKPRKNTFEFVTRLGKFSLEEATLINANPRIFFWQGGHSHSPTAISPSESFEDFQLLHRGDSSILEKPECRNKRALLWMMMFSEALHTASDGLATGAAFSSSVADGLSTSLAVLFHEIPHAVGVYTALLKCCLVLRWLVVSEKGQNRRK